MRRADQIYATREHFVRQTVQDGIFRDFDSYIRQDGSVDLVCDPGMEIPLENETHTVTLRELAESVPSTSLVLCSTNKTA